MIQVLSTHAHSFVNAHKVHVMNKWNNLDTREVSCPCQQVEWLREERDEEKANGERAALDVYLICAFGTFFSAIIAVS